MTIPMPPGCEVEGCDHDQASHLVHPYEQPDHILMVCRKCYQELINVFGWEEAVETP